GDILLGTEQQPFAFIEDLSRALRGSDPRQLRLDFLRGDYARVRRVTIQLGRAQPGQPRARSSVAGSSASSSSLRRRWVALAWKIFCPLAMWGLWEGART